MLGSPAGFLVTLFPSCPDNSREFVPIFSSYFRPVCRITFEPRGQGEFEHGCSGLWDPGMGRCEPASRSMSRSMISNFGGPMFLEKATIQSQLGPLDLACLYPAL